jgi:hypothetical protein
MVTVADAELPGSEVLVAVVVTVAEVGVVEGAGYRPAAVTLSTAGFSDQVNYPQLELRS